MIVFSKLRTKRLTVQLKEMSIGDALYLLKLPANNHEAATTEFLRRVIEPAKDVAGQVNDPEYMTVHERGYLVAHYLAHTMEQPDFPIGKGKFSEYILDGASEPVSEFSLGEFMGDQWLFRPILGRHAESVERLIQWDRIAPGVEGWLIGSMAAAMTTEAAKEHTLIELADENLDALIQKKCELIANLPQSDFHVLVAMFFHGIKETQHLLRLSVGEEGFVFENISGGAGLAPARFPVNTAISEDTRSIFGKPD